MKKNIFFNDDLDKQLQVYQHPEFKPDLETITQTRVKTPSKLKLLHSYTQTFVQRAQEKASTISFGLTITYPLDQDYNQSWTLLQSRSSHILKTLYQYPIYCLLLSVEIHKDKKDAKKRKLNTNTRLKGRPHLHICLMLYHDFLCPSISLLEES